MSKYTERPSMSMCMNHEDYQRQMFKWQKSRIEELEKANLEMLEMLKAVTENLKQHIGVVSGINGNALTQEADALITEIESE